MCCEILPSRNQVWGDTTTVNKACSSAVATAIYQCFNNGGKHPQAGNQETVQHAVSASQPFTPSKNGNIIGSLKVPAPSAGGVTCPNGQILFLESVQYGDITLSRSAGSFTNLPDVGPVTLHMRA
jgi:hypothetical protein